MITDNTTCSYLAAYNASSVRGASAAYAAGAVSASASVLEIVGGVGGSVYATEDGVEVSEIARELLARIKSLDVFSCIYPNNDATKKTKSLDEVEGDFLADFQDFSSYFSQMAGMMGLSGGSSFAMGLNGVGGMTVEGADSAMAEKLASGFSANETLTARFAVMAARAALTDAGKTVGGFKEAYAEDPVAAIQDNIGALKERLLGFRAVSGGDAMRYGFIRDAELEIEYEAVVGDVGGV